MTAFELLVGSMLWPEFLRPVDAVEISSLLDFSLMSEISSFSTLLN